MTDIAGWKLTAQGAPNLVWDDKGLHGKFIIKAQIDTKEFDDAKMLVSGFATVEEVDKQGDLITLEAFKNAITRLQADEETLSLNFGHTSAKIGTVKKMVFMEDSVPRKLWIEAQLKRNSKLAKQAWEDVKVGKLKAFSIGGMALVPGIRWCEANGKCVNKIDDIELYEVSLVEEPANPKSLIMAIKSAFPEFIRTDYVKEGDKMEAKSDCDKRVADLEEIVQAMVAVQAGQLLGKKYGSFDECVADNQDKENPEGFCAWLGQGGPSEQGAPEGKGAPMEPMEMLLKPCHGKLRFPKFGRKKGEELNKADTAPEQKAEPPKKPVEIPQTTSGEMEALKAKIEAMEAEVKLHRMEREKAEKALEEARKEIPKPSNPAPVEPPQPAPTLQSQPPSKGEHPNASPKAAERELTLVELAHKLNDEKKPLSWGMNKE